MATVGYEFGVLGRFDHTGSQNAGTIFRSSAAELDAHEMAEILYAEILPPFSGAGAEENLSRIQFVLDDKPDVYNIFPGTDSLNVFPPKTNRAHGQLLAFGKPLWSVSGEAAMLQATCPKYRKSVRVEVLAGDDITGDYSIILYGYKYKASELPRFAPVIGGHVDIADPITGRTFPLDKAIIPPSEDTWTQLPGGMDQAVPKINNRLIFAVNAGATTPNLPYDLRFDIGHVASREEDMYFPYDTEKKLMIIKGLGVRAATHLKETFISVSGTDRPKAHWITTPTYNPLHFGKAYPFLPTDVTLYHIIPALEDRIVLMNDKAYVEILDDGNSISAGAVNVALNGVLIELT